MPLARCSQLKEQHSACCCKILTAVGTPANSLNSYLRPSSVPNHRGILQPADPALTCHRKNRKKKIPHLWCHLQITCSKKDSASHFTKIVGDGFCAVSRPVIAYLYCHIDFLSHQINQNSRASPQMKQAGPMGSSTPGGAVQQIGCLASTQQTMPTKLYFAQFRAETWQLITCHPNGCTQLPSYKQGSGAHSLPSAGAQPPGTSSPQRSFRS